MYFFIKIQNTQIFGVKQIFRYIFNDSIKYNTWKQSKFINKFLKNKLKRYSIENINPTTYVAENKISVHTQRRMNVLNKVFMEHITDMISTGEVEPEILNRNIEISHVKITPNFKLINVYWIDNNEKLDTEELLQKCAFQLRHKLSQLRVVGIVPPIQFVKCKNIVKKIEEKLKIIQLEENYIQSPYPDAIHHTITASDDVHNNEEDKFSIIIPIMKHDVFGLDHFRIMSKIKNSLNKSLKKQTININSHSNPLSQSDVKNSSNFLIDNDHRKEFDKFLNERRKEQRKKNKRKYCKLNDFIYNFEEQDVNNNIEDNYDDFAENDYDFDENDSIYDEFKKNGNK